MRQTALHDLEAAVCTGSPLLDHDSVEPVLLFLIGVIGLVRVVHAHDIHAAPVVPRNKDWRVVRETHDSPTMLWRVDLRIVNHNRVQWLLGQIPQLHSAVVHGCSEGCGVVGRPDHVVHSIVQVSGLERQQRRVRLVALDWFCRPKPHRPIGRASEEGMRHERAAADLVDWPRMPLVRIQILLVVGSGTPVHKAILRANEVSGGVVAREVHAEAAALPEDDTLLVAVHGVGAKERVFQPL
mmetsp:Transcript_43369/g.137959  ORF Transcript_43369/g.137959 Transcript_43369/m.137959 type:complete len:240 (-) Transcript_43369:2152-2871(-)